MKILVLGAGVIGVTTAYYLAKAGFEVTVLDRQADVARETSFANGGQFSAASGAPWAGPEAPGIALKSLFRRDAPFVVRLRADPEMWSWGLKFLRNCTASRALRNRKTIVRLGLHSRAALGLILEETDIRFDRHTNGILCLYRSDRALGKAARDAEAGSDGQRVLTPPQCVEVEPALASVQGKFVGGVYYPNDESGDARRFTEELCRVCRGLGVSFVFNAEIRTLRIDGGAVTGVETSAGPHDADAYLLCLGSFSAGLCRGFGLRLPIYPVKGYSVTLPVGDSRDAPMVSIHDEAQKIVISRLGDRLRAAGTAELAGYDLRLDPIRARAVLEGVLSLFPDAGEASRAEFWAGLRPMTPDGAPILGPSPLRNLFLNTGHGTLGWTLACGSGRVITDILAGRKPEIDLQGLTLGRF